MRRQQPGPAASDRARKTFRGRVTLFSNIHVDFDLHTVFLSRCSDSHFHVMQRVNVSGVFYEVARFTDSIGTFVQAVHQTKGPKIVTGALPSLYLCLRILILCLWGPSAFQDISNIF
jgi:hypothetical protein